MTDDRYRTEQDAMGTMQIPDCNYYGIQTVRAIANFQISGIRPLDSYVTAGVLVKKATALVNGELGCIPVDVSMAIASACDDILDGKLRDQFVVDIYQAGAGTSHHMNLNEVIANRALEIMGELKGSYHLVHPNDHVNYGQSTNDVIPTAIRIGALLSLDGVLFPALGDLSEQLRLKAIEFEEIVKSGRTHLQDAVPVRLGDTFQAYAQIITEHYQRLLRSAEELKYLGLGGSAAGTGLNTHPEYAERVAQKLSELTGFELQPALNLMSAMQSMGVFVQVSGALRNLAQDVSKIASDLRLLDSGPNTGLKEINLPPVQPGSSIMPGKYNPVIAEMTNMVCFQVIGYDTAIVLAAQAGQLELNVMMPLIAYNLIHSIEILGNALYTLSQRCIKGITANEARCRHYAESSLSLVTVLNPYLGYAQCAEIAKESLATGKTLRQIVLEKGLMSEAKLAEILDLAKMSRPHL
ncbi:MAG: aspartate ammonia-lyase [Pseudanabaenaceae cyanobacterium]